VKDTHHGKETPLARVQEAMKRLTQGMSKVGQDSPETQLVWLVDFAQRDLSIVGAPESARWEAYAFCVANSIHNEVRMKGHLVARPLPAKDNPEAWVNPFHEGEMLVLQNQLRQQLRELRTTQRIQFPAPFGHSLAWSPRQGMWMETKGDTASEMFSVALAQFLIRVGKELRVCEREECARFFLAIRSFQKYCSRRCENLVAVAKFRQAREASSSAKPKRRRKKNGTN